MSELNNPSDPYCYAPWTTLYVRSTSDKKPKSSKQTEFSPCCAWQSKPVDYSLSKRDESYRWQKIKKRMIEKDMEFLSTSCAECIHDEKRGYESPRQWINNKVKDNEWQVGELNQLDFRPSNLCNLKCAMCNPLNSSLLAEEQDVKVYQFNAENVYNLDLSKLKVLKILGGEPSIQPEVYKFLNYMIDTYEDLPDLHFTSNMTNTNKKWIDIINKFDKVNIMMSIDGIGETFEYLRQPAKWHIVERNINTLKQLQNTHKGLNLDYHVTIGAVALLSIESWLPYFINEDVKAHFFPIQGDENGTINSIPKRWRSSVIQYLKRQGYHPYIDSILNIIKSDDKYIRSNHIKFVRKTRFLDTIRKRNVDNLSTRIKSYMQEIG